MTREQLDELDLTDGDTHIIAYIDRITAERDRLIQDCEDLRIGSAAWEREAQRLREDRDELTAERKWLRVKLSAALTEIEG